MTAKTRTDTVRERAALYALGALPPDEARDFEALLAGGDAECRSELDAFRAVVQELAHAAEPHPVPPALRDRVLARIAADDAAVFDQAGLSFVRSQRIGWEASSVEGVQIKRLSVDVERGRRTSLVRMEPGATYPAHRHSDVEETYVLEGELFVSGVLMRAGDYCRAEADTVHQNVHTQSGCVFIVTAIGRDQRLG